MGWLDFAFAVLVAVILTAIFSWGLGRSGPWGHWWSFFLIVLLGSWIGALWARPVVPRFYDIAWLPIFFTGLLFALLLAAATPVQSENVPREPTKAVAEGDRAAAGAAVAIGAFFYLLIFGLLLAAVYGLLA